MLGTATTFAQGDTVKPDLPVPVPEKVLPPNKGIRYCCIKRNYSGLKPGQCPIDNTELIREGDYYCETCDSTSSKPVKCRRCAHNMVKIQCPVTVIKDESEEY